MSTATTTRAPSALRDGNGLCDLLGISFSAEQLAAITAPMEPGVIVAGAGSGKTTVMAARVVWLVGTGQALASQVLGLTFTTKAAAELGTAVRTRLQALANPAGAEAAPVVSTYHAYAGGLLLEHGLRLGYEPDLRLVPDASRYQLAARVVTSFTGAPRHLSVSLPRVVEQVIQLDNELSDHLVDVDAVRDFDHDLRRELAGHDPVRDVRDAASASHARDELLELVVAYRRAKAEAGVTEFADQMAHAALLAEHCPEVGADERDRFRVVLLDEYQDTSVSQRRLLQGLFSGATAASGRGHPVTAVGDPCQAIYGWRGATVDNVDEFPRHFRRAEGAPAQRFGLTVSRRCGRAILAAANDVAADLYDTHHGAAPLAPSDDAPVGAVRVSMYDTVADEVPAVVDTVDRLGRDLATGLPAGRWSDIAVLVRDGNERAALTAGLRRRGIPVEVVGLAGLLSQPEVGDVLATLRCVSSLTANTALLRLLAGPRWRIGPRDLALLGARARELVHAERTDAPGLRARLAAAVASTDRTEVVSLSDALDDPGGRPYSAAARTRFRELSGELTGLRRAVGDPLVDLVRRVVDVLGVEVELAATPDPEADVARDNLARFLEAVGDFSGTDPTAGLAGLLGWLDAELEHGRGMEIANPGPGDSVKLLTVHSAKGLEWRAVVLPFLSAKVFPSAVHRPRWERTADVVPAPLRGDAAALPALASWTRSGLRAYRGECDREQELEERRLAYVAITRAKEVVVASGHWWGRTQKRVRGPSPFLTELRGHGVDTGWAAAPEPDAGNPLAGRQTAVSFPGRLDEELVDRRRAVAAQVRAAMTAGTAGQPDSDPDLAELDAEIDTLLAEAGRGRDNDTLVVDLPGALAATTVLRLRADPEALARDLVRPMPRRPSPAGRLGTRFHAWVESHLGQQQLIGPDELPGRADAYIDDDADLRELTEAFRASLYSDRNPYALEAPFQLVLAGQLVVGRIDAVYSMPDGGFEVVDWKTSRREDADPNQLAIYRLAWAELHDLPVERVSAAFYYVRTGAVLRPPDLPDRDRLTTALFGAHPRVAAPTR